LGENNQNSGCKNPNHTLTTTTAIKTLSIAISSMAIAPPRSALWTTLIHRNRRTRNERLATCHAGTEGRTLEWQSQSYRNGDTGKRYLHDCLPSFPPSVEEQAACYVGLVKNAPWPITVQ
jgi:hypothetical protein